MTVHQSAIYGLECDIHVLDRPQGIHIGISALQPALAEHLAWTDEAFATQHAIAQQRHAYVGIYIAVLVAILMQDQVLGQAIRVVIDVEEHAAYALLDVHAIHDAIGYDTSIVGLVELQAHGMVTVATIGGEGQERLVVVVITAITHRGRDALALLVQGGGVVLVALMHLA